MPHKPHCLNFFARRFLKIFIAYSKIPKFQAGLTILACKFEFSFNKSTCNKMFESLLTENGASKRSETRVPFLCRKVYHLRICYKYFRKPTCKKVEAILTS